ncbi:hypothetical protein [Gracilibacillus salinarum]|uniref:Uncharacterized protein n=1 Tax=Gracilibacillus salinarum TaxID=2932255 RepID=A0ABY4GP38_9BACI|nr:hypothetical protein [Gracilibacillus salinarum]UOQ86143.1 hypothetical protein MUN87_04385 [Gracilibacillus salinarum]
MQENVQRMKMGKLQAKGVAGERPMHEDEEEQSSCLPDKHHQTSFVHT